MSFSLARGTQSKFVEGWSEPRRSNLGITPANESRYLGWVEMRALTRATGATTDQLLGCGLYAEVVSRVPEACRWETRIKGDQL